jgi:hypothetical protein
MWDASTMAILLIGHSLLTICCALLVFGGIIKKDLSPFSGWFNGMTEKADLSAETWDMVHRYSARRRVIWALVVLGIAAVLWFIPLPQWAVIVIWFITAIVVINIPSVETALYIKRLDTSIHFDASHRSHSQELV